GVLVEVASLLDDRLAGVEQPRLAGDLEADGALDGAEGVDVLRLGAGAERGARVLAQGDVDVGADVAALHPRLGDVQCPEDVAQGADVRGGDLGGAALRVRDRLGDDLDERDAGAVVVHLGVGRAVDAAGRAAHVGVLARVLLHMGAFDLDAHDLPVLELDVDPAVEGDGLVVLRGLEVLGEVRVEVLLAREAAGLGDGAVQRQADLDRVLDSLPVHHRQRAGQAQRGGGDRGVRLGGEDVRRTVEHLGLRAQLDVDLDAEHRVVAVDRLVVVDERGLGGHQAAPPASSGALASSGPPQASSSSASRAPPTRYRRSSARAGARNWIPAGRPSSARPEGSEMPGVPARLAGMVAMSFMYIAVGSSIFSPRRKATVGAVGEASTATLSKAAAKSRCTRVRTFWVLP